MKILTALAIMTLNGLCLIAQADSEKLPVPKHLVKGYYEPVRRSEFCRGGDVYVEDGTLYVTILHPLALDKQLTLPDDLDSRCKETTTLDQAATPLTTTLTQTVVHECANKTPTTDVTKWTFGRGLITISKSADRKTATCVLNMQGK